jgi:hypothetical protein
MISSKAIRTFALVLGSAALYSGSQLQAATRRSESVTVPFAFQVQNTTLPAGQYRVEQQFGTEIASIVNVKTRRSVQILRPATSRVDGSTELTFVQDQNGYRVKVR